MAFRLFNGRSNSENGWWYVDEGSCTWLTVLGCNPPVQLQIQNGQPLTIMGAFAADFNAHVEPLRNGDSACWTVGNSVATSNHPGGTAMDLNWDGPDGKTFRYGISKEMAYPGDKSRKLDELLEFYEGMIFCGGEWSIRDWMHFQMNRGTWGAENVGRVQDFINRKIRPDGWSTFKRGGVVAPPQPSNNAADVLARATGITVAKATSILPQVSFALVKGNCTNPRRIAAALAQWVIESGHFVYTEEIASGPETEERWKYKGRTWIQLTWLENYRGFSVWCHGLGLVPTPDYFVVHPRELADQEWAALGPAYWWAVKYPRINEYADRGDIDNVSKWVNAPAWVDKPNKHANHEKERRDAYNQALALGDQLLALINTQPGEDDDMIPIDQWNNLYHALMDDVPSLSPLRHLGEGNVGPIHRLLRNIDGSQHIEIVKTLAMLRHPPSIELLQEVANADPVRYPDRQLDAQLAQAILAEVFKTPDEPELQPHAAWAPAVADVAAKGLAETFLPTPEDAPPTPSTAGQVIGELYDVLDRLRLADALPIEGRAPLAALISVLQTKNGSQLS